MKTGLRIFFLISMAVLIRGSMQAQFAPPAGQPGSTAIYRDSSIIIGWAVNCSVTRGYINIADTTVTYNGTNKATYGSYLYASGPSDEYMVSLGDKGSAVLGFDPPIVNKAGADFAVFENSFSDQFLELAFVEVSSDGVRFVRFPAVTNVPEDVQIPTFGTMDATLVNNFAGKYRMGYGTPFNLDDIKDSSGINLNHITFVKIVDVGGSLIPAFASYDSKGHKINDPWPTPFDTGGFDLDAVGVIHNTTEDVTENSLADRVKVYPNPVVDMLHVEAVQVAGARIALFSPDGRILYSDSLISGNIIDISGYASGIYLARITFPDGTTGSRKIVKN